MKSSSLEESTFNPANFVSNRNPWFIFGIHYSGNASLMHVLFSKRFFDITCSPLLWLGGNGNPEGGVFSMLVILISTGGMIVAHRKMLPVRTTEYKR